MDQPKGTNQWEHWYGCTDAVGRPGKAAVIYRDGQLILTTPSPGTAVFEAEDIDQIEHLRAALAVGVESLQKASQRRRRSS